MSQRDLFTDERRLFEELCRIEWLEAGLRRVKQNKGSPGVDGVTIAEFESRLDEELGRLQGDLECCLSDYLTANFPGYFATDSAWVPTLILPVR